MKLRPLLALALCLASAQGASAVMMMVPAEDSGFLNAAGRSSKNDGVLLGAPPATFNYSTGTIGEVFPLSGTDVPRRNFFSFDLSGISSGSIVSAALVLFVPISGYTSPDATETYELTGIGAMSAADQSTFAAELTMVYDITVPAELATAMTLFDDIGAIPGLGSESFGDGDEGADKPVPFSPAGVSYLNMFAGGDIVIGGEVTTLDLSDGIDEVVFGMTAPFYSGVVTPDPVITPPTPTPFLVLDVIPEPSAAVLALIGLAATAMRRRQ